MKCASEVKVHRSASVNEERNVHFSWIPIISIRVHNVGNVTILVYTQGTLVHWPWSLIYLGMPWLHVALETKYATNWSQVNMQNCWMRKSCLFWHPCSNLNHICSKRFCSIHICLRIFHCTDTEHYNLQDVLQILIR